MTIYYYFLAELYTFIVSVHIRDISAISVGDFLIQLIGFWWLYDNIGIRHKVDFSEHTAH